MGVTTEVATGYISNSVKGDVNLLDVDDVILGAVLSTAVGE